MTPTFNSTVESFFDAYMQANQPSIPFYFTNSDVPEDLGIFVVFHILASEDVLPINLGIDAKSRNPGLIQIDVYAPKGVGGGPSNTLAYNIGRAFKRLVLPVATEGYVTFKDPSVQDRGEIRGRHKEQVRVPYRYDFSD